MTDAVRSIFLRRPVPVTLHVEGEESREILVSRITARHAQAWEKVWSEFNPTLLEFDQARMQDFVVRIVKAGLPEPDPLIACPQQCQCAGRQGLHDLIDRLGREEIDVLYGAVLEANVPKELPRAEAAVARSRSTRRWPARSWLDWAFRRRWTSRSRSSATSS